MAFANKIELSDFSGGLISDLEAAKLPASAASTLQNADIRNKFLQTLPGVTEVNDGFPAGFVKISEEQFLITEPSEEEITLTYGTLSGANKLYVRPYLNSSGTFVDALQDLTEKEGTYTDSVLSGGGVTVQSNSLDFTTTNYYKGWIFVCTETGHEGSAIITASNASRELTLSWAITGMVSGDDFFICRNPVYDIFGTSILQSSTTGYRFLQRGNSVAIVTGSDVSWAGTTLNGSKASDLLLTVLNNYGAFDDTDLDFTGFYLASKPPTSINPNSLIELTAVALAAGEQEVPVPTSPNIGYIVLPVLVYDGYQQGPRNRGGSFIATMTEDGTTYALGLGFTITGLVASRKIQIALTAYYGRTSAELIQLEIPDRVIGEYNDLQIFPIFDRRITSIRFYMAEIESGGSDGVSQYGKLSSELRLVDEVFIDKSAWSGSGPSYTQTINITGEKWEANAGVDISDYQGHDSLSIFANAEFIASAKKRVAVANVYADEKRQSFVFFSAINSDEKNMPDVIPHTSFLDLSLYGIPKIMGFIEALGFYVAIGENQLVKIDASGLAVDKNIQARGVSSPTALVNANGLIYFCNLEDIYYYHPSTDTIRSIATGFIREAWRGLTTANKQAAAIGYDRRFEMLVVAAGSTIYTYNLPAAYASDLAQDTQAIGSWQTYSVNKTFNRFYTKLDGACVGIASDGKSYELFSSGIANTMTFEKVLGESDLNLHTIRLTYEASATVTAKIFDKTRSDTYPIRTFTFPAQSKHKRYDIHKGAHVKRPLLQITASVGTKISEIVVNPDSLTDLR